MHIDDTLHASPTILSNDADATLCTLVRQARDEGTNQIDTLRNAANEGHIADHIRGMVAATMSNLSIQASDVTQNEAQQWQQWALGVADGLAVAG
jgi:hypothetical protein